MKRGILMLAVLTLSAWMGAMAQNCDVIMLPYFQGDAARMAEYPAEKIDWRCRYARNAFYESDTVPAGAELHLITEVTNRATGEALPATFRVDLSTLSYYAYDFSRYQYLHPRGTVTLCFSTPASQHPYLVVRSLNEIYDRTENPEKFAE